ncbi:MAG TPA: phosphopantetheine-binding protein [Myxococcales bacterium]|jgi:acyl carrier protein
MTPSEASLFEKLRRALNLTHIDPSTITGETPLFGQGLELDSIDVLEISTMLQKEYGVVVNVAERGKEIFGTVGTLAAFVERNRGRDKVA